MKLGIMQPYFFPYLGYFSLIKNIDFFVLLDVVQFIRHGWIDRNRILKPTEGWQYIRVGIDKFKRETLIKDIIINENSEWKDLLFRQLLHYKKKAPFYFQTIDLLKECFSFSTNKIVQFNAKCLELSCEYMNLPFNYSVFSEMDIDLGLISKPGDWALKISQKLQAREYINPIGGKEIFDGNAFKKEKIELLFLSQEITPYNQKSIAFEPSLSIIDVMMFNPPDEILKMLGKVKITKM